MAKRNYCFILPNDIHRELNKRLIDSEFSDYDAHADWLKSLSHPISRSAIQRYGSENELEIRQSVADIETSSKENNKFFIDIRMRCLEVSSGFAEGDFDLLFKKADVMLNWVKLA